MVGADRMAALHIFVIIDAIAEFLQSRGEFARVAGVDAVVLGRQIEEDRRVFYALPDVLVWRIFRHEGPVAGHVGIAIFGDPRGTSEQLVVAQHILQRRTRNDRAIEVGPLFHRRADEDTAVRTAGNGDLALGADPGGAQILGDRVQVVEAVLALLAQRRLMPGGTIFAAAADVGEDIGI